MTVTDEKSRKLTKSERVKKEEKKNLGNKVKTYPFVCRDRRPFPKSPLRRPAGYQWPKLLKMRLS